MNVKEDGCMGIRILSPVTGQAVKLDDVPDPVFSGKILGDGAAVIPSGGKILSPVNGEVVSVAETLHAYGLRTEDGLELLIHVGLDTVQLKGECFHVHVKEGDRVSAGDLLAEVDLDALKEKGAESRDSGAGLRRTAEPDAEYGGGRDESRRDRASSGTG